jgi:hypothetical protein
MDLQGPLVLLTFPHASAVVSKTRSYRKVGFW